MMTSARKLERVAALRRQRAERQLKSLHTALLEAQAYRAHLEQATRQLAHDYTVLRDELATQSVIGRTSSRQADVHRAKLVWIEGRVQANDAECRAHSVTLRHLEERKAECVREIGKQGALESLTARRRRADDNLQRTAQEDEEADEFLSGAR